MLMAERQNTGAPYRRETYGGDSGGLPRKIIKLRALWNKFLASESREVVIEHFILQYQFGDLPSTKF